MLMWRFISLLILYQLRNYGVESFTTPSTPSSLPSQPKSSKSSSTLLASTTSTSSGRGFGSTTSESQTSNKPSSTRQLKQELVDLISSMMGTTEELQRVEELINTLESRYTPPATLGFCLLYTSPSPRDRTRPRMPSSA